MIVLGVAGLFVAVFGWYLFANVRGLQQLRRIDPVPTGRAYEPPLADKPLDSTARALIRELHSATPTR